jgi:hypothetical protein
MLGCDPRGGFSGVGRGLTCLGWRRQSHERGEGGRRGYLQLLSLRRFSVGSGSSWRRRDLRPAPGTDIGGFER